MTAVFVPTINDDNVILVISIVAPPTYIYCRLNTTTTTTTTTENIKQRRIPVQYKVCVLEDHRQFGKL